MMPTKYKLNPTRAEMRKEMAEEKVAPPRGETKKQADIFKEGMKPPQDDEGSTMRVSAEEQKRYTQSLESARKNEMKRRGLTQKQFADEANKDIGGPKDSTDYKKGGTASARADGIAQRGKTKGKMY